MVEDYQNYESDKLTKKQKIMTLGLSFFGIMIVVLWGWQLRNNLVNPLMPAGIALNSSEKEDSCADGSCGQTDDLALYMQDTDGDGLSDWEELNIYFTSPYLEDTDGDGYSDFEEVKNNKDPNCPAGQDCYSLSGSFVYSEEAAGEEIVDYSSRQFILNQASNEEVEISPEEEEILQEFLSGQSEADILRALLLEAGVEAEMVNQFSDEELLAVYKETLQ